MRLTAILLIALTATTSCESKYSGWSDEALHRQAQTLPLRERYDFYLRVYRDSYPHRTAVADDIADLGKPAWKYTLGRATQDGFYEGLNPAIPVLIAFNMKCSDSEYRELISKARTVSPNPRTLRIAIGQIGVACGLERGMTNADYEKLYPKQ